MWASLGSVSAVWWREEHPREERLGRAQLCKDSLLYFIIGENSFGFFLAH